MSDKVIIVTDMPGSCSNCKFMYKFYGVKKCQLLNVLKNGGKAIICVDKLNVARKESCPLVSAEEYDKEIRDKAIEGFAERLKAEYKPCEETDTEIYKRVCDRIDIIAEKLKEVGE